MSTQITKQTDKVDSILQAAVSALSCVPGVLAVVLGGSRALGIQGPDSDIDIGVYYDAETLCMGAMNAAAAKVDDDARDRLIAPPGNWGEWVNGGGWLSIQGMPVDIILRDADRVRQVIEDCRAGKLTIHYHTGHPHAYMNAMYMGELSACKVLWENSNSSISQMQQCARIYPDALGEEIMRRFMFEAHFSLSLLQKTIVRDDAYYAMAHMVRVISCLNQVLFAVNHVFCLNEKKAVWRADRLQRSPKQYKQRVDAALKATGTDIARSCELLEALVADVDAICSQGYH